MMKRLSLAAVLFAAIAVTAAGALDIDQGRLRLQIHEGIGRFGLSYLPDRPGAGYVPLLLADDPRTTVLTLVEGNRAHRMGESAAFSEKVDREASGAAFVWTSKTLEVTEKFSFVASPGSVLADGLRIDVTVRNISDTARAIGVRYLFDTYLGEAGGQHFWTPLAARIDREQTLVSREGEAYWVSSAAKGSEGLQVMVSGEGITRPEKVVFANWKRLNEVSWGYETSSTRNFNQLPYSVNDSAAAHYYTPRDLPPGQVSTVTLVIGLYNAKGFSADAAAAATEVTQIVEKATVATASVIDPALALKSDLETLDKLIAEIDRQLASGNISEADLPLIEKLIADLQAKYK
jgi:hypothetical protein